MYSRYSKYCFGYSFRILFALFFSIVVLSGCSQDSFGCVNGHSFETIPAVEATCTNTGLTEGLKCSICGYVQVKQQKIPMKNHLIESIPAVESTCASVGLTEGLKCSTCGYIQVEQKEVSKKKHTIVVDRQGVRPSLLTEGISDQSHCSVCGEIVSTYEWVPKATPRNGNGRYGFDYFETEPNKQKFYDALYIAAEEVAEGRIDYIPNEDGIYVIKTLNLNDFDISIDEAVSVWVIFLCDNPAYYFIGQQFISYGMEVILQIAEEYSTYEERKMYDESIEKMIHECGELFSSDDLPLTKAVRIHDYIARRISYAYQADGVTPESSDTCVWTHNITGVSYLGRGVCESYAKTFQFLCNVYGVEGLIVTGESGGEEHAWNYICIDDEWYLVDVTFDDKHDWAEWYRYFGVCSKEMDIVYQPSDNSCEGVDYLYPLPSLSEERLMLVELYKDDEFLGIYGTPDKAFGCMSECDGSYGVELYSYNGESAIETAFASLFYSSKISDFPKVKKISINGKKWFPNPEDNSYYFTTGFNFENIIFLNSDLCISDVQLHVSSDVNLNSKTLFLSGSSRIDSIIGCCGEIYGLGGGSIVSEFGSVSDISINTTITNVIAKNRITFHDSVYIDNLQGRVHLFNSNGGLPKALINNCLVSKFFYKLGEADCFESTGVSTVGRYDVTIGNIVKVDGSDFYLEAQFEKLSDYPTIRIEGESECDIDFVVSEDITYVTTTVDGEVVNTTTIEINPFDLSCPLVYSNSSIDISKFHVRFSKNSVDNPNLYLVYDRGYELAFSSDLIRNGDYYVFHDSIARYCGEEEEVILPSGYTKIGNSAFKMSNVRKVSIPEGFLSIQHEAFCRSEKLQEMKLPSSLELLADYSFYSCGSLETIEINGPVTEIPSSCFFWCQKLKTVILPNSIERISDSAFDHCTSLTDIIYRGSISEWKSKRINYIGYNVPDIIMVHCTDGDIPLN